ncbi:MAG: general secretion pathway protein GspB [Thermodesulfovibrionales bacterium]
MSFILDQLKKSGKKRELELAMRSRPRTRSRETEGASHTDLQPTPDPGIPMRGIYLLLSLAAASFFALGGFMLFRGKTGSRQAPVVSETQVHTAASSAPETESVGPKSVLPVENGTPLPSEFRSKADPEKAVPAPAVVKKMPDEKDKTSITPVSAAKLRNQPGPSDQGEAAALSPSEKSEPQDDSRRTPYLNELPASLKKALPPIRITSHLYRGNSGLVSINGRIMSEGVSMDDGLFLEKITPEGVILLFRGHRFRVRAE